MPMIKVLNEKFPKATVLLEDVEAHRQLEIDAGAISSTIDDQSDPLNYILITVREVIV